MIAEDCWGYIEKRNVVDIEPFFLSVYENETGIWISQVSSENVCFAFSLK